MSKVCSRCGVEKGEGEFSACRNKRASRDGLQAWCKTCQKEYGSSIRDRAFEMLGGKVCSRCGCDDASMLEINHINSDGSSDRFRGGAWLKAAIVSGTRDTSDLEVTCCVCNIRHHAVYKRGYDGWEITWTGKKDERKGK